MRSSWVGVLAVLALLAADRAEGQAGATVVGKVRLAKDLGQQVDPLLRPYLSSDGGIGRGTAWLELCEDAACRKVVKAVQVPGLENYVLSSGFPKEFTVTGLPTGTFFARVGTDTARSQAYGSPYSKDGGFGPFDLVQSEGVDPRPSARKNPPAATVKVTLGGGARADLGTAVLGTLLLPDQRVPATPDSGWLLAAASGAGAYRNHVKIVDTHTGTLEPPAIPKVGGAEYAGDLCGFVRGPGAQQLYVIGVGNEGAHVFFFDLSRRAFSSAPPLFIPHPDCKDGRCPAKPSVTSYPWLCRGTAVERGGKIFLYLIDFKGAGSQPTVNGYHLAVADVTALPTGGGQLVATYGVGATPWLTSKRIFRGVGVVGDRLVLVEPSWSKQLPDEKLPRKTHLWMMPVGADGKPDLGARRAVLGETADETCGATNSWAPGFTVLGAGASARMFLGNDASIGVFGPDGSRLGDVPMARYGALVSSFGLSPDGMRLHALPSCKSTTTKAKVPRGPSGSKTATLDRHAVVVLDVSAPGVPPLVDTDRDLDGDGTPDGGIDLEFLHHKGRLLRWCEDCTGVVPPTSYTGPELVVGRTQVYLRGTGIQGDGKGSISSSGLGQVGDVGFFDRKTGRGAVLRDHDLWIDGPSSRWGFDLDPGNPARDFSGDVSVAALFFLPRR